MCASLVQRTEQRLGLLTGLGPIQIPGVLPPATREGAHSRDEALWTEAFYSQSWGTGDTVPAKLPAQMHLAMSLPSQAVHTRL